MSKAPGINGNLPRRLAAAPVCVHPSPSITPAFAHLRRHRSISASRLAARSISAKRRKDGRCRLRHHRQHGAGQLRRLHAAAPARALFRRASRDAGPSRAACLRHRHRSAVAGVRRGIAGPHRPRAPALARINEPQSGWVYTSRGGFRMGQVEFKDFLWEALIDPARISAWATPPKIWRAAIRSPATMWTLSPHAVSTARSRRRRMASSMARSSR